MQPRACTVHAVSGACGACGTCGASSVTMGEPGIAAAVPATLAATTGCGVAALAAAFARGAGVFGLAAGFLAGGGAATGVGGGRAITIGGAAGETEAAGRAGASACDQPQMSDTSDIVLPRLQKLLCALGKRPVGVFNLGVSHGVCGATVLRNEFTTKPIRVACM